MDTQPGSRRWERSAISAFLPVAAMLPFSVLALAVLWLPLRWLGGVPFLAWVAAYLATGLLLFLRPVQIAVLIPILGARRATPEEAAVIEPIWGEIAAANALPPDRYVTAIVDTDELNAYACGGHLVVLTSFAVRELSTEQLRGVLAHELSHHLGMHTVALTIGHWISAPVVLLARIGVFLENAATAAGESFGRNSPLIAALGSATAALVQVVSWIFTASLRAADTLANLVGHRSEYDADQRAVRMGFGRELASALRHVLAVGHSTRPVGWRARLSASHPPARTRVARIDTLLRHPAT
jgi:Zn-dependent protease with chaperone function